MKAYMTPLIEVMDLTSTVLDSLFVGSEPEEWLLGE